MSRNGVLIEKLPLSIITDTYNKNEKVTLIGKYKVLTKDDRYLNFIKNGFKCAKCGIVGQYVHLEHNIRNKNHLNVYGVDCNGKEILLTKDHIYPKSKGGLDNIINYQVLCEECNGEKSDKSPITLVQALNSGQATKKSVEKAVKQGRPKALIGV